jgi:tetratricopeptide (TPR) repeat protein
LDRPDLEAAILRQLGRIARDLGDLDGAQTRFEAAAQAFQRAGSEAERGNLLIQMGAVESERGAWAAARELLLQGLRESEAGGRVLDEAWALDNLAIVEACVGRLGDALDRGRAALTRAEATGGAARILASRLNLAGIMIRAGANAEAARLTESALALAEEIEDLPASVLGHLDRSEVLHRQGDTSGAVEAAEAALEVADRVGAPHLTVFARLGLSDAVRGREPERAAQLARDALAAATGMAAEPLVTLAQRSLAEALLADGDLRGAEEASQAAASALDAGGVAEGLEAQVYLTRYRTLVAAGNPSAAETLAKAQAIAAEIGSTLPDPDLREAFWSDVPAHAAIRRAVDDGESGVAPAEHP